jgi:hypothetical protein
MKEGHAVDLVERAKKILLQPAQEWQVINTEAATTADLYKNYIVPLAAIGPIASLIGMSIIGISVPFVGTYRVPLGAGISHAVVHYVMTLAGVYVLALIINALAPTFGGEKNDTQALKVATYASTAAWLAGVFALIPALSVLSILGLYGLYLLYLGLPVLMKAPQEKALQDTGIVVVAAIIVFAVISVISGAFVSYPTPGMRMPGVR